MLRIRAICFDLDDTLWDMRAVLLRAEALLRAFVTERYPALLPQLAPEIAMRIRQAVLDRHPDRRHDLTFLRKETLREICRAPATGAHGHDPERFAEEGFEIFFAERNRVTPFPDVAPALERLRAGFRLLSLSNGNADLHAIGLGHFFELSLNARQTGAMKPHPAIYEALLERSGLEPAEVLHVGDDPENDVEAPMALGMHAVWLNRGGRQWPTTRRSPSHQVRDLHELAHWLDRR